jgi:curved DNA-binding protein CbpA
VKDLYAILQVTPNASKEVIRASYLALSKVHHPDKGGNSDVFKEIAEAYEILKDDDKRQIYDAKRMARGPSNGHQQHAAPGRVWVNGIGWVDADQVPPGTGFPGSDYGRPQPYPGMQVDYDRAYRQAAENIAHEAVDILIEQMFGGMRRRGR